MLRSVLPILLAASLFSCATIMPGAPTKPNVELGIIDYPNSEVITNMTGARSFQKIQSVPSYSAVVQAIVASGNRVPLASYHKAICFKPVYWQTTQNYINALVRYIQNHCANSSIE